MSEALSRLRVLSEARRLPGTAVVEAPAEVVARLAGGSAAVEIAEYEPTRVVLMVRAVAPVLVVLTDTWDSGWGAEVDGARAPIYPTDVLFRGIPVAAGEHRVVLRYRPLAFAAGLLVALCSVAAVIVGARRGRERG